MPQVEIDVDEFVDGLDSYDTKKLIKILDEDGILDDYGYHKVTEPSSNGVSVAEQEFLDAVSKLGSSYMRITKEEEELIKSIAKRF